MAKCEANGHQMATFGDRSNIYVMQSFKIVHLEHQEVSIFGDRSSSSLLNAVVLDVRSTCNRLI